MDAYNAVMQAKRKGNKRPPRIDPAVRLNTQLALMGIRIETIYDSPLESRLWRVFRTVCQRLDRP